MGMGHFACRCANFPVKFVFVNYNLCVVSGVGIFKGLFCVLATIINEAPGTCEIHMYQMWAGHYVADLERCINIIKIKFKQFALLQNLFQINSVLSIHQKILN